MEGLFFGSGIAHTILLVAFVVGIGLYLGRFKLKGISLGATWILFVGILMGHLGFQAHPEVLHFIKEFGLILFVFSIGLQVGPGFFQSFRSGGVKLNLLAVGNILLAVLVTWVISILSGEDLQTLVGVMSGAVTNTPGLGAAQQTFIDVTVSGGMNAEMAVDQAADLASGYAVAYPFGVVGVILVIVLFKTLFHFDPQKDLEKWQAAHQAASLTRRMHVAVENPAICGKKLSEVIHPFHGEYVVSRMMKGDRVLVPTADTVLEEGDKLLLVTSSGEVDRLRILFGKEIPMHQKDWMEMDHQLVTKRIVVTQSSLTGKKLKDLQIRSVYGVSVTRIIRAGVELVASGESFI